MNHKKITTESHRELVLLFKYGIPTIILAKVFNVSYATIQKKLSLAEKEEAEDFQELPSEKKLFLFKLYAWIITDEVDCAAGLGTTLVGKVGENIYKYLKLEQWENMFSGMKVLSNYYGENHFHEAVTENYRNLINELFPATKVEKKSSELFKELLILMHKEEIPFPTAQELHKPTYFIQSVAYLPFKREGFVRYFDEHFVSYLNYLINNKIETKKALYLRSYFGLSKITFPEMYTKLGNTESTAQDHKRKTLRRLRGKLEDTTQNNLSFSSKNAISSLETSNAISKERKQFNLEKSKLEKANIEMKKNIYSVIESIDQNNISERAEKFLSVYKAAKREILPEIEHILDTPLEDMDMSVRLFNCLRDGKKIKNVRDIVQYEPEELMKIRNFGQKSLAELEWVFTTHFQNKVWLGMNL